MWTIRPATPADDARLAVIAAEGDAGADPYYLSFIREHGRLLVAERDEVVAFGGMVPVGDVAMVTDLFVATTGRGSGVGGALLAAVLDGWKQRMTCSSRHPAALPAYQRAGLEPRWRVDYLRGHAVGGGAPFVVGEWSHDRAELVEWYRAGGATVSPELVVEARDDVVEVRRLQSDDAMTAMAAVLHAFAVGRVVHAQVPAVHPLHAWLLERGFVAYDYDTFCATPDVEVDPRLAGVDPGFW